MTEIYCEYSDGSYCFVFVAEGCNQEMGNAVRAKLDKSKRLIGWKRKRDFDPEQLPKN